MQLEDFIKDFEQQFEEVQPGKLTADTLLDNIDEWGSIQVLVTIAMIDSKYKIRVTGDEINNAKTIKDIFEAIQAKTS